MKKLSDNKNSQINSKLDIQEDALLEIAPNDLIKYLQIANKFISDDAKDVISYCITYPDLGSLEDFYNKGISKTDSEAQSVWRQIAKLNREGRLLELPQFQTKEQFTGILNQTISPDEILLDLVSERGRAAIAKKFMPLCHKIANSYVGKSNLSKDELLSAALLGLTYAMNGYGKKSNKATAKEAETGEEQVDMKKYKSYTFFSFAAQIIQNNILDSIKTDSHIVRIPISQQNKERKETGRNTRSHTISGDEGVGGSADGDNIQTRFDKISADMFGGDTSRFLDSEDLYKDLDKMYKLIEDNFPKEEADIWFAFYGVNGHKKEKGIDLEKKYNKRISYLLFKINRYLKEDPKASRLTNSIRELMSECLHYEDELDNWGEVVSTRR